MLVWMNFSSLYARIFSDTQIWSTYSRVVTWPIVWELFKANPVSGLGPANYHYFVSNYSFLGYFLRFNTHNNYFDILLQAGLIGLTGFLWLAAAIILIGWRLRKTSSDGFTRGYANGMLAALAAVLASGFMADYFLPFVYNIGINGFQASVFFWLFAGGLASLHVIEKV
jgi:O-antigen ligase